MNLENWPDIAKLVGAIDDTGKESGSSDMARSAIEQVIGEDFMRSAVHYYIESKPGWELIRNVLWQIQPYSAMKECYKIFTESRSEVERASAIELLRVVADKRVLKWIPNFLSSDSPGAQAWGIGIVDQLVFSHICYEEDVKDILSQALNHENKYVREQAEEINKMIKNRNDRDAILEQHYKQDSA